ncbi:unnamed protein product [Citrullus colocynthis]|uniref:Secreted protein n=1 Tax=Citrullus colocynthis TaxID=252529 RepID=A0ABP0Z7J8_9ROSI
MMKLEVRLSLILQIVKSTTIKPSCECFCYPTPVAKSLCLCSSIARPEQIRKDTFHRELSCCLNPSLSGAHHSPCLLLHASSPLLHM